MPLEIFNTPKVVLPSSILVYHIKELSERHGNGELPWRLTTVPFKALRLCISILFSDFFLFTRRLEQMVTSRFSLHSSYVFELRSILRVAVSRYCIAFQKARPNSDFPGLNLKDGD